MAHVGLTFCLVEFGRGLRCDRGGTRFMEGSLKGLRRNVCKALCGAMEVSGRGSLCVALRNIFHQ